MAPWLSELVGLLELVGLGIALGIVWAEVWHLKETMRRLP